MASGDDAGTVVWVDLQTPDLDKARKFYGELLGWSFTGGDDPKLMFYTLAQLGGRDVAGLAQTDTNAPRPPTWTVYFGTSNADETVKKARRQEASC